MGLQAQRAWAAAHCCVHMLPPLRLTLEQAAPSMRATTHQAWCGAFRGGGVSVLSLHCVRGCARCVCPVTAWNPCKPIKANPCKTRHLGKERKLCMHHGSDLPAVLKMEAPLPPAPLAGAASSRQARVHASATAAHPILAAPAQGFVRDTDKVISHLPAPTPAARARGRPCR